MAPTWCSRTSASNSSARWSSSATTRGRGCSTSTSIGAARVTRAFLPLLRRSQQPHLVFTASSSVLDPASRLGAYQAIQVRGARAGGDPASRAGRGRHRRVGDLPVGDDHAPPREQPGRRVPVTIADPIAADEDMEAMLASDPGLFRDVATAEDAARQVRRRRARGRALHRHPRRSHGSPGGVAGARAPRRGASTRTRVMNSTTSAATSRRPGRACCPCRSRRSGRGRSRAGTARSS